MAWKRPAITETISPDQTVWFISDLHLGDGTPSDAFFGKDRHLKALVDRVDRDGSLLIIAGDAMDFHQAWTLTRILRAHQELLGSLSQLARSGRLIYVVGNHDWDISFYRDLLNFRVVDELHLGKTVRVSHGFEFDPYIGRDLEGSHFATKVHHLIERYCNTWIRVPLGEFYTTGNRISFWTAHKAALLGWAYKRALESLGFQRVLDGGFEWLDYWARTNMGDPMGMFRPVMRLLEESEWTWQVCGHSHLPGVIRAGDKGYVNTGSWTFSSTQYAVWDGKDFRVRDWITGREFKDEFYRPVQSGAVHRRDFWQWWRENYMGRLRFREGEERKGHLRGWESFIRDHQYGARLDPLHLAADFQPDSTVIEDEP